MWRLDRCEGATVFAAGCTLILPITQSPETGTFPNRGRLVFGATLVQHHRAFYSRKQPELRLIFRPGRAKKNPVVIETTGFLGGTPERISPPGDKPRIRGAQQKNLPHGRFFMVRPSGFEPLAYRVGVCHSIQLSYGRIFSRSYYSKVRAKCKAGFSVSIRQRICYTEKKATCIGRTHPL